MDDLDDLLDSALEEYETVSSTPLNEASTNNNNETQSNSTGNELLTDNVDEMTQQFLSSIDEMSAKVESDPELRAQLAKVQDLMLEQQSNNVNNNNSNDNNKPESIDDLAARLRAVASEAAKAKPDENQDELLERVLSELDSQPEMAGAMEQFMEQIMSKDILYDPMVELRDSYPKYFQDHGKSLSNEDKQRYEKQFKYISEICVVYEKEPIDYDKLTDLMATVQECGKPPEEIVSSLTPEGGADLPPGLPSDCTIQ
mmetsp:Transcript_20975/g.35672  ORF Transcript_20975/g.35672 Transcript_20975/m.35672 type:complete len:257 (+) Transcript_20975:30-800(+)